MSSRVFDGSPTSYEAQFKDLSSAPVNYSDVMPDPSGGRIWRLQPSPLLPDAPAPIAPVHQPPEYKPAPQSSQYLEIPVLRNGEKAQPDAKRVYDSNDWRSQVYKEAAPAVSKITVESEDGSKGTATGFFVSADGLIATDNHVATHGTKFSIQLADGRTYSAHVVGNNPGNDLALLQVDAKPGEKFPFLRLAKQESQLSSDDPVAMVGHPLGWDKNYLSEGSFSRKDVALEVAGRTGDHNPNRELLRFNMHGEQGNSGSPILNKIGEVVGVMDAGFPSDTNVTIANPVSELRRMVPGYKEREQIALQDYFIPSSLHFGSGQIPLGMLGGMQALDAGAALKAGSLERFKPSLILPGLAGFELARYDAPFLLTSLSQGTTAEAVSAGIDVAGDAMMVGGIVGLAVPQYRALSATVQLIGAGVKLGNSVLGNRKY